MNNKIDNTVFEAFAIAEARKKEQEKKGYSSSKNGNSDFYSNAASSMAEEAFQSALSNADYMTSAPSFNSFSSFWWCIDFEFILSF